MICKICRRTSPLSKRAANIGRICDTCQILFIYFWDKLLKISADKGFLRKKNYRFQLRRNICS